MISLKPQKPAEHIDQTEFVEVQSQIQPPPSSEVKPPLTANVPVQSKPIQKKLVLLILVIVSLGIILLTIIIRFNSPLPKTPAPGATPNINIIPPENQKPTEFSQRLENLKQLILQADPSKLEYQPPPLDYDISL